MARELNSKSQMNQPEKHIKSYKRKMSGYKSLQNRYRLIKPVLSIPILIVLYSNPSFSQNNFKPGEELEYLVYFGPVNAGMAVINLQRTIQNNQQVFYSKLEAKSIGLADKLYRIRDTYECYFDSVTVLPFMAIRNVREGRKYKKKNIDTYNHKNKAIYSVNKGEIEMLNVTRDVISAFYFIRNYNFSTLKKGDIITTDLLFDDELMTFRLHYMGKEAIESKIGKFNCLKLVPELVETKKQTDSENVSPSPKDEMIIWLSDDPNQVPIRVRFNLFVGSIKADLIEYYNLKY